MADKITSLFSGVMEKLGKSVKAVEDDHGYPSFEKVIAERVAQNTGGWLFTTDASGLWEAYLTGIPEQHRQHYNCRRCKEFIEKYGRLVSINSSGEISTSMIWGVDVPQFFLSSVVRCGNLVAASRVTGVFINDEEIWGTPFNVSVSEKYKGQTWSHLSGKPSFVYKNPLKAAYQLMAEKHEDYIMVRKALAQYPLALVEQAVRVLDADALDRSEKTLGVARWFRDVHLNLYDKRDWKRANENIVWLAVATAPPGFCHIRSTMIGTLLDDLASGMDFETVSKRWTAKMHPLQYQRPTAAICEGQIKAANAIMDKLGSQGSLARRYARLEDILESGIIWRPSVQLIEQDDPAKQTKGAFDHLLKPKPGTTPIELPEVKMTWQLFKQKVLPGAREIEFRTPSMAEGFVYKSPGGPFFGLVTAANPQAPAIIQWDGLLTPNDYDKGLTTLRNPVSWYFYHGESTSVQWNLQPSAWVKVNCIMSSPAHWQKPQQFTHYSQMAMLVLEGAKDTKNGAGLFPEIMKSDYHGIRAAIEAHAGSAIIDGREEGDANGYALQEGQEYNCLLRVRDAGGTALYKIDRWQ